MQVTQPVTAKDLLQIKNSNHHILGVPSSWADGTTQICEHPVTMLPYQVFQWFQCGPMNPFLRGGRKQVILAP